MNVGDSQNSMRQLAAIALTAAYGAPRTMRPPLLFSARGCSTIDGDAGTSSSAGDDSSFMRLALTEAEHAAASGEVPIGAVLVRDGAVVASARNRVEELCDASAHAELLCMRAAAEAHSTWRLNVPKASTLYVTLEPCPMCLAAMHAFRVSRVVYGAPNERMGAIDGKLRSLTPAEQHPYHSLDVTGGVLAESAGELMRRFFRERRERGPWVPPELLDDDDAKT